MNNGRGWWLTAVTMREYLAMERVCVEGALLTLLLGRGQ